MRTNERQVVAPTYSANAVPPEPAESSALPLATVAADRTPDAKIHAAVTAVLAAPRKRPEQGQVTAAAFARETGWGEAYVSMYRNAEPGDVLSFDVRAFEKSADEWLAMREVAAEAVAAADQHMETAVSRGIAGFVKEMERMRSVGVVLGDAGIGKTCALRLVRKASPRTVLVTVSTWCEGASQVASAIFKAMGMRDGKRSTGSKMERVARELQERPRTLLIDNAHQLRPGALRFLFNLNDLHEGDADRPQSPIVLVGNPEIEDTLRANDQFRSRLARVYDANRAARGGDFAAPLVRRLALHYLPEYDVDDVVVAAVAVATSPAGGRFRAAGKAMDYAAALLAGGRESSPLEAFRKAVATLKLEGRP